MSISDILAGKKILEEVESPLNGRLRVIRDLAWGTYIQGGGLTQSGGILEKIWQNTLKQASSRGCQVSDILILGLGGGSLGKLLRKSYPDAKIVGVDIDPIMVELGKKYLKLDKYNVDLVIEDAVNYLESRIKNLKAGERFDLVCIDLYCGEEFPEKFEGDQFIRLVKKSLSNKGTAIFNRTYYDDKRSKAKKFGEKLEKHFGEVKWYYPEANLMFIARK